MPRGARPARPRHRFVPPRGRGNRTGPGGVVQDGETVGLRARAPGTYGSEWAVLNRQGCLAGPGPRPVRAPLAGRGQPGGRGTGMYGFRSDWAAALALVPGGRGRAGPGGPVSRGRRASSGSWGSRAGPRGTAGGTGGGQNGYLRGRGARRGSAAELHRTARVHSGGGAVLTGPGGPERDSVGGVAATSSTRRSGAGTGGQCGDGRRGRPRHQTAKVRSKTSAWRRRAGAGAPGSTHLRPRAHGARFARRRLPRPTR